METFVASGEQVRCFATINNQTGITVVLRVTTPRGTNDYTIVNGDSALIQLFRTGNQTEQATVEIRSRALPFTVRITRQDTGRSVVASSFIAAGCNTYVLTPAQPSPPPPTPIPIPVPIPFPTPGCSSDPTLRTIATYIISRQYTSQQLIQVVQQYVGSSRINTLICLPFVLTGVNPSQGYLLELAVIIQDVALVQAMLNLGANPNLSSEPTTIIQSLFQPGTTLTSNQIRIIQLLVQYGATLCPSTQFPPLLLSV